MTWLQHGIALLVWLLLVPAATGEDVPIARLIERLGASEFNEREAAAEKLAALGERIRAALNQAAAEGDDLEIRGRAAGLIGLLDSKLEILRYDRHSNAVFGVAFTPDGRKVVSASFDDTVRLIDVDTGKTIHSFPHPSARSVAVSSDGTKAISAGYHGPQCLRLWNLETGREEKRFCDYPEAVCGVAFSPDSRLVLFGAFDDKTMRLLDLKSGRETRRFAGHSSAVHIVAYSSDGKRSLSGSYDGTVRLWDNDTGRELKRMEGHASQVWGVALSHDGKRAVSGGDEEAIKVWNLETGEAIHTLKAPAEGTHAVAFSRDGRRIASASYGAMVSLWDAESGRELHRYAGHGGQVYDVAFSPDGRLLASGGQDNTVRVWRVVK